MIKILQSDEDAVFHFYRSTNKKGHDQRRKATMSLLKFCELEFAPDHKPIVNTGGADEKEKKKDSDTAADVPGSTDEKSNEQEKK